MKIVFLLALILFLTGSYSCAQNSSVEDIAAIKTTGSQGSAVYTAGQVEWIARAFSPECRIKKTGVVMTGG